MKIPWKPGTGPRDAAIITAIGLITTALSVASLTTWAWVTGASAIAYLAFGMLRGQLSASAKSIEEQPTKKDGQ